MMDACPKYNAPVVEYELKLKRELYQPAVQLHERGEHEASFRMLLRYINEETALACEGKKGHWTIPHGSLIVEICLTDDGNVDIWAPFVKLPPDRRAPLLRQTLEMNTNILTLPKLGLDEDRLTFRYSCPLSLAEPDKMYRVLFEICINGDTFDDEFVSAFGAVPLREKQVTHLPEEQVDSAWNIFSEALNAGRSAADYYMSRRWTGSATEILGIQLMSIDHAISPQGFLRTRLERTINHLWDQRPVETVYNTVSRGFDELMQMSREDFAADFYQANFFMNAKKSAEFETCRKSMNTRWEWAKEDRARRNNHGVALCYLFAVYECMYNFFVPRELQEDFCTTLAAMSGQEWDDAGEAAWQGFIRLMDPASAHENREVTPWK